MQDYIIMTDSCCDLTDHMARELELNVVPLTVHMDGKDYANLLDGSEISFEDFYKNIRSGVLGTTSAANVGQFEDAMRAVLAQGKDIVSINFSSALSATYQNAVIAAKTMADEFPDSRVYVVDSLSASLGQGLLLYLAVQKKREGLSAEELVQWVEENRLHIDHWFTVDDLNYLKMGGRLSAGAAFFGSMLSIKPVMHTSDEGKLVPVSKVRGRKASLKALIDKIAELGIEPSEQVMFICHADCEVEARAVAEENPDDVVCGFDTVVECEGEVFGKPKDEADAVRMLRALSGREHRVHTGVCICRGRRAAATVETTVVHFSPIAEDDLCAYVRTPEPYDKAGAYAIQGHAALWCAGIEGCYYNIMGLPVHRTAQLLRELT